MTEDRKRDLLSAIIQTRGASALVWNYTASHAELTIRVEWPSKVENMHIVCSGCQRFEAPSSWRGIALQFEEMGGELVALEDQSARFRVVCGIIRLLRNVEPVFVR